MANVKKALAIGAVAYVGIGTLTFAGFLFLLRAFLNKKMSYEELGKLGTQLQTFPKVKIHRMDFTGLTIRVDVLLKNPTMNGFKIAHPFINVEYQGKPVGSSKPESGQVSIPPNTQKNLEPIYISFPLIGMLALVGGLVKSLQSGQAVTLDVTTQTTIDPMWKVDANSGEWTAINDYGVKKLRAIPYTDKKEVTLKKSQA